MELRYPMLAVTALAVSVAVGAACSATGGKNGFSTGTGANPSSGTGGASSSGNGMGGNITFVGSSSGGPTCDTHCSSDLHSVLDCNNQVVMTCPMDQGCGMGGCVPACDSAQQNKSTIGCDYYAVDPDIIQDAKGACFAAFVANTWNAPVTIQVERAGQMLNAANFSYMPVGTGQSIQYQPLPNGQLPAGQVAIVFLGGSPSAPIGACPAGINVGYPMDPSVSGTGTGYAFHITTSAPVVAYDIFPYGGGQVAATSATLLIPTTAWDTNYIAVDAYAQSVIAASAGAEPSIDIVAAEDGTNVTISPSVAIVGGGGVAGTPAGTPHTYQLNKGQVLQFSQPQELTGSVIQSDKPVGHWGGASCLNIPTTIAACDSAHQQIPPIKALGHEYVAVRYRSRFAGTDESVPWRIVGAVDGTILTYDPAPPTGAPIAIKSGQLIEFNTPGPFSVKSQDDMHPFYMSAHMTGCQQTNPSETDCRGDPEFVNVIPPQQYLASYVFFTDPTYPETNLVLIRAKDSGGFHDVKLDCNAGNVTGWMPVGSAGDYEYARVDLVTGNFQGVAGCDNGRHEIHSDGPFGLAVWGWGSAATGGSYGCPQCGGFYSQAVSYAYPAGASVQPINTVVVPPMQH